MFQFFPVIPVAFYIAGIFKRPVLIAGLFIQSFYILLRAIKLGRIPNKAKQALLLPGASEYM
ncbi:MAG: hypothetical protein ACK415_01025 [Thermodesulfovibrionales bacterium]